MRTLSFSNNPSYLKNMVYNRDIPGATTRLPGGVASGFPLSSRLTGSCYVIEEEQPTEGQVDNNGNNQRTQLNIPCNSAGVDRDVNFPVKDADNIDSNSGNSNNNHHNAARLSQAYNSVTEVNPLASLANESSSSKSLFSNATHGEVNLLPQLASNSTLLNSLRQQHATSSHMTEVKSGHLILIIPELKLSPVNPKSECSFLSSSRTLPHRCPVIVKIHDRGYEKYAIISSTRRQLGLSPFCVKLKHSYVSQSTSNPSHFSLVIDSSEGKTFTFEASSPDVAKEWMQALTLIDSSLHRSNPQLCFSETSSEAAEHTQYSTNSKSSHATLNLAILPLMPVLSESVEEEDEE
ncbi:unnamed protein product [Candidula unifasciata]|uniref:PH domain-containing protein n=1 Tax=Candidula unifasciata TaxID=100452 RepID=A0A8S3ZKK7_9EUPU|nr:unnamed protein product [Candidula unifasciata]